MDKKIYKAVLIDIPEHERLIFKLIFSVSEKSRSSANAYVLVDDVNEAEILIGPSQNALDSTSHANQAINVIIDDSDAGNINNVLLRPLIATRVLTSLDTLIQSQAEITPIQNTPNTVVEQPADIEQKQTTGDLTPDESTERPAEDDSEFAFSISEQEASELAIVYDEELMNPANLDEAETVNTETDDAVRVEQDAPKLGEVIQAPIKHQKQEQVANSLADQSVSTQDSSPRALVVDDSASVRKQLELELELFDVKVDYAGTAAEANQLLDKNEYHVAFLDVMLPDSDGFQICKQIKSNTKSTNVVMLTGKASPADKVKGSLAGCDDYLVKPVGRQTFQNAAKKYLNMNEHEAMEA